MWVTGLTAWGGKKENPLHELDQRPEKPRPCMYEASNDKSKLFCTMAKHVKDHCFKHTGSMGTIRSDGRLGDLKVSLFKTLNIEAPGSSQVVPSSGATSATDVTATLLANHASA